MDHSIQSYIAARSPEELLSFLYTCMADEQWDEYAYMVPLIFSTLRNRHVPIPDAICASWQRFLCNKRTNEGGQ